MTDPTDRRAVLTVAGAAALAAAAGPAVAQADIHGVVTFEGGAVLPEGELVVSLADRANPDAASGGRIPSDGATRSIAFSLPSPASPTARIVARLERADGWLLARGSASAAAGAPVSITLRTVVY